MLSELRKKKVLRRIGELISVGLTENEIGESVKEEFGINASEDTISRVIKTYSIRKRELMNNDEKFKEIYRETILNLINKVKSNIKLLEDTREIILKRLDEVGENKGLELAYVKEVYAAIRTQNDSVKTMNEVLKRLEVETKETKISAIQEIQLSIEALKELEKHKLITILPDYYKEVKQDKENNEKEVEEDETE
jgi:hypothetical protein